MNKKDVHSKYSVVLYLYIDLEDQ